MCENIGTLIAEQRCVNHANAYRQNNGRSIPKKISAATWRFVWREWRSPPPALKEVIERSPHQHTLHKAGSKHQSSSQSIGLKCRMYSRIPMTLTLNLSPELEQYLIQEADQHGLSIEMLALQLLKNSIAIEKKQAEAVDML